MGFLVYGHRDYHNWNYMCAVRWVKAQCTHINLSGERIAYCDGRCVCIRASLPCGRLEYMCRRGPLLMQNQEETTTTIERRWCDGPRSSSASTQIDYDQIAINKYRGQIEIDFCLGIEWPPIFDKPFLFDWTMNNWRIEQNKWKILNKHNCTAKSIRKYVHNAKQRWLK